MILLDKYVKFLAKHKISERQLLALMLAYSNRGDLSIIYKDAFETKDILTIKDKEVLKEKGLVRIDNLGRYVVTDNFKKLFVNKDVATEEIFRIYPSYVTENDRIISACVMDRSVFANLYNVAILSFLEEHEEVVKDIEYGKAHKLLNIGIEKFLKSKYWLDIRKIRLSAESKEAPDRAT